MTDFLHFSKFIKYLPHSCHRFIGKSGWKGPQKGSSPNFCSKQGQPRSLSSLVLKTSRNRDCTTSVSNLLHCLTVLMGDKVLLISTLNLSYIKTCSCLSCRPLWRAWLLLLNNFFRLLRNFSLLDAPKPTLPHAELALYSQPLFSRQVLQSLDHLGGPPLSLLQFVHVWFVLGGLELDAVV